ncbi:LacI family DNA-binding transcriptional regulator [Maribacter polysiphoniae]|uniref:LacI family DNA-binding transcriptional regulator n=1 Tax=Maribacter polysiphoniae TaxID=429344 RepID=UPI002355EA37|nr:substrate-binding domain-containing protein [Maribacter polysiphoniae]
MGKQQNYGIREIAKRANVSIGTVDRVIHKRKGVSEKTRLKILKIIEELDYQPNVLASRLASKKIYRIGVLVPSASKETDFWNAPIKGMKRAAEEIKQYGVEIYYCFFQLHSRDSFLTQIDYLWKKEVHGVILSPLFKEDARQFVADCNKRKLPLVYIDSYLEDQKALSYIGFNLNDSGRQVAQLFDFCLNGKDKILVANISWKIDDFHIEQGFRSYFIDKGSTRPIIKVDIRHTDYAYIKDSLQNLLKEHTDIKGIFVTNSRVNIVAKIMEDIGRKDIFIIGYDMTEENLKHLKKGTIHFLICHKPEFQGYQGIMTLYQYLVLGADVKEMQYMPIDILTNQNYQYYQISNEL